MDYNKAVLIFLVVVVSVCFLLKIMDKILTFLIDAGLKRSADFAISMNVPNKFAYESVSDFSSLKSNVRDLKESYPDISNVKDYKKYGFAIILLYSDIKERERLHALIVKVFVIIRPQMRVIVSNGRGIKVTDEIFAYVFMLACSIEKTSISLESVIYIMEKVFYGEVCRDDLDRLYVSVLESEKFYEVCRKIYLVAFVEVMAKKGNYLVAYVNEHA